MKINIFWGELTDISAKKEALVAMHCAGYVNFKGKELLCDVVLCTLTMHQHAYIQ